MNQNEKSVKMYNGIEVPTDGKIWKDTELGNDEAELARAKKRREYFFHAKNRTNVSEETEIIMDKLKRGEEISRKDEMTLYNDNPEQVEKIIKMQDLRERTQSGNLDENDLRQLCDTVFGKDSEESKTVYDKMIKSGKVQLTEKSEQDKNKSEDMSLVENPNSHTDELVYKEDKGSEKQEDNKFIADLQKQTYTKEEITKNDVETIEHPEPQQPALQQPAIDIGGMEI